jgi:hypothetical protein
LPPKSRHAVRKSGDGDDTQRCCKRAGCSGIVGAGRSPSKPIGESSRSAHRARDAARRARAVRGGLFPRIKRRAGLVEVQRGLAARCPGSWLRVRRLAARDCVGCSASRTGRQPLTSMARPRTAASRSADHAAGATLAVAHLRQDYQRALAADFHAATWSSPLSRRRARRSKGTLRSRA